MQAARGCAHQLEVLTRDRLKLQEAVDQVGGKEERLRHQLRAALFLVIGCWHSARKCAKQCLQAVKILAKTGRPLFKVLKLQKQVYTP